MPSPIFDIPGVAVTRQRTGTKAEETADTGPGKFAVLTPATRKITLTAKKLGVRVIVSREEEESASTRTSCRCSVTSSSTRSPSPTCGG